MNKVIITVLGKDIKGIIARVTTYLADKEVNILDISQTIVGGFFHMMMIADASEMTCSFEQAQTDLDELGTQLGIQIKCQREEIFERMHRI